jgi:hypothetical protein
MLGDVPVSGMELSDHKESRMKRIVCLDFDGVIHSYQSGWKGARNIPDPPVEGAIKWIEDFIMNHCDCPESICCMAPPGEYELNIFSSRSRYIGGRRAMKKWLVSNGLGRALFEVIKFPTRKPPAFLTIDDRAMTFTGTFPSFKDIDEFRPWNKKKEA